MRVRADRSLVPRAVDEALRWDGPLTVLTRQAMCDVELEIKPVAGGTKIDVVQASANRDPARHPDPDRFDIYRPATRNLAFAERPPRLHRAAPGAPRRCSAH